ncbi:MAG: DUF711 family protein [Candidatus Promineifilaceae bacterium]|nr:DUF711 family protein [Candidatus Promineifilaceae bacterium]
MEIRSVTLFSDPALPCAAAHSFFEDARQTFSVPVQSARVALPPFPEWWPGHEGAVAYATALAHHWGEAGADYLSVGPVQLRHDEGWLAMLPEILGVADMIFASAEVADQSGRIDLSRAAAVARVIQAASTKQPDGFGNLYFTALANCPPGSPFFPVAYHDGGSPGFALAAQAADLALAAVIGAATLEEARRRLVKTIEEEAERLGEAARRLEEAHALTYRGIDFSLAPFPDPKNSLGAALEALGIPAVGAAGSLFAAAFVTEAIDRARFPRCGFSGLMLPVLEDGVLAARAADGTLSVGDLLTYAAVCGVGLDTIPLPGAISVESLTAILLDVAALAVRLNKPLTARLMPLPGLETGDPVTFDFPYFADSRVMNVAGDGLSGLLARGATISLRTLRDPSPPLSAADTG